VGRIFRADTDRPLHLIKGSKCLQSASFHNSLYICALAHLLQTHYLLPFMETAEKPSFRRRVVSARKSQTLQVSDLQHFVKRGSVFYLLPFTENTEKSSFCRRVVSTRKSQTLQVSDLQHFVKRGSVFYLLPFNVSRCSAICTAFRAAPLRMLSATVHSSSPFSMEGSRRTRLT